LFLTPRQPLKPVHRSHRQHFPTLLAPAFRCPRQDAASHRCLAPVLLALRLSYPPHSDNVHSDCIFVQSTVQFRCLEELKGHVNSDSAHATVKRLPPMSTPFLNPDLTAKSRFPQIAIELLVTNGADRPPLRPMYS